MKLFVAGHNGMVGSAICRANKDHELITADRLQLDLLRQGDVEEFFYKKNPEAVILAAAKVGGIHANNTYRGEFIYSNLQIQSNVIHAAYKSGVKKLIFLGSSCIYPRDCEQPIREEELLSGALEKTNEPYAVAKIAGIKMCESYYKQYGCNFYSVMPTNLYGPKDSYDLENAHVLPSLIRKFHEAKIQNKPSVTIWGTGKPKREFLHVDDLAEACLYLLDKINAQDVYYQNISHLNIGYGSDISIKELAELIKNEVGFNGKLVFDDTKPDGTPRKLLNCARINVFWTPKISLKDGIRKTYQDFKNENGISNR